MYSNKWNNINYYYIFAQWRRDKEQRSVRGPDRGADQDPVLPCLHSQDLPEAGGAVQRRAGAGHAAAAQPLPLGGG